MIGNIDATTIAAIDRITREKCVVAGRSGELKQLARLFGKGYLEALHAVLSETLLQSERMSQELTIRLAWIDKIPLAEVDGFASKTELGDAVLFSIRRVVSPAGDYYGKPAARAVLLQAKVADNYKRISRPLVPVQPMEGSTQREFELLSRWPRFNLFKASRSEKPLASGVDLRGAERGLLPYGWYIVAPRVSKRVEKGDLPAWTSWWMGAPAMLDRSCDITFGTLLGTFLTGRKLPAAGNLEVGRPFSCEAYPPAREEAVGWDRVCAEILAIAEGMKAPKAYFGSRARGRLVTTEPLRLGFQTAGSKGRHLDFELLDQPAIDQLDAFHYWPVRRFFERLLGRRRMPVVVFDFKITEG